MRLTRLLPLTLALTLIACDDQEATSTSAFFVASTLSHFAQSDEELDTGAIVDTGYLPEDTGDYADTGAWDDEPALGQLPQPR